MTDISIIEDEIVEYLRDMAERGDQKAKTLLGTVPKAKVNKKCLQEKLAELYEMAVEVDIDTASIISMAEDTVRRSK